MYMKCFLLVYLTFDQSHILILAKYEVFIEELDREINNNPADIARMIELLLSEGNVNFK